MTRITRVLSFIEYLRLSEEAVANGMYRDDRRVFTPGTAWYQPYYYDPRGELAEAKRQFPENRFRATAMFTAPPANPDAPGFLSPHYWRDWATKRAPICVVCPNGEFWEVDRWSSNGTGWTVTGELPNLTCSPSIVVTGYHGFLRDGEFTPDLEGRGETGIPRALLNLG